MTRVAAKGLLFFAALLSTSVGFSQSPTVRYIYDELGRLVGVIDPNGEAATYQYDAVGNILSIGRIPTNNLRIIEFTPNKGPVGSEVTIQGIGFSATPSQNTVKFFDNQTAAVTSASTTQLVVTVPSSAATGPIFVKRQSETDTTTTDFEVGPSDVPTLSGFSPQIASSSDPVTITGTNFSGVPSDNVVGFNLGRADIVSASATSLGTTVPPNTGSGRVRVSTPTGSVTSMTDLFIPPPPFAPSAVEVTARMMIGGSGAVNIATAEKIGMMLFDGLQGQRVGVEIADVAMGPNLTCLSAVQALDSGNGVLASAACVQNGDDFIEPVLLQREGTYAVLVDPFPTRTGTMTLLLHDVPPDETGTIVPGGAAETATITKPGQNALRTFTGTAGQAISLEENNVTIGVNLICGTDVYIRNPDESVLASNCVWLGTGFFIDTVYLPTAGEYSILVDPKKAKTGSMSLKLNDVPNDTGQIDPNTPELVVFAVPGENPTRTFNGAACHTVSVDVTNVNISGSSCLAQVHLIDPLGSYIESQTCLLGGGTTLNQGEIGSGGTYTILVDPRVQHVGDLNLILHYDEIPNCGGGGPPDPPDHVEMLGGDQPELTWIAVILGAWGL